MECYLNFDQIEETFKNYIDKEDLYAFYDWAFHPIDMNLEKRFNIIDRWNYYHQDVFYIDKIIDLKEVVETISEIWKLEKPKEKDVLKKTEDFKHIKKTCTQVKHKGTNGKKKET